MNHKQRILDRVLLPNFIGAILCGREILCSKISLIEITADVSLHHTENDLVDILVLNYGDYEVSFYITYEYRESSKGINYAHYIIRNIE